MAVGTLEQLLELVVIPAKTNDRAVVGELTAAVQAATGGSVQVACVDDGYNEPNAAAAAQTNGIDLVAVTLPNTKRGFVLLPRRWVIEHSFAWTARFRRLSRDYERLPETVAGLHLVAFTCLMAHQSLPSLIVPNRL